MCIFSRSRDVTERAPSVQGGRRVNARAGSYSGKQSHSAKPAMLDCFVVQMRLHNSVTIGMWGS